MSALEDVPAGACVVSADYELGAVVLQIGPYDGVEVTPMAEICLPPELARELAFNLTKKSMDIEEAQLP